MIGRSSRTWGAAALLLSIAASSCVQKPPPLRAPYVEWFVFDQNGFSVDESMAFSLEALPLIKVDESPTAEQFAPHVGSIPARERFDNIHGIPCVIANSGDHPSNMDLLVSLEVENASAWEAMVQVLRQVRCNLAFGDRMRIMSMGEPRIYPPPAFWEEKVVTLRMNDVTAREAICAILEQSPVQVGVLVSAALSRYWKGLKGSTYIRLYFYEDGKEYMGPEDGSPPEGKDPEPFFDGIRAIELSPEECEELGLVREDAGDEGAE